VGGEKPLEMNDSRLSEQGGFGEDHHNGVKRTQQLLAARVPA
jgi:hypothetical protein